jgi:LytR cell envelope-related transcriptional attenuator
MHVISRLGPPLGSVKDVVDSIGPIFGIAAFVGLAVLAFLLFQEAREVRRLREWAGRAPERAAEAVEAQLATAEARDEATAGPPPGRWERFRLRVGAVWASIADRFGPGWRALDRRSPVDPRILLVLIVAVIVAAIVTSGFGLISSGGGGKSKAAKGPKDVKVAVLNGTQEPGVSAVPHLATQVSNQVVEPAGYKTGPVTNAPASFTKTVVMFRHGHGQDAKALATTVKPKLGQTPTQAMTGAVQSAANPARLALVIGLDDSSFGQ